MLTSVFKGGMKLRTSTIALRNQILSACARLFLKQGYQATTIKQIAAETGCSVSSVQNLFRSKDVVLSQLVSIMFSGQFDSARSNLDRNLPPCYIYAIETAIQLTLVEANENLRELYIEAYAHPDIAEMIYQKTTVELFELFGDRFDGYTVSDFYELEIGTAGIMRGYMSKKCDIYFPLDRKIERFLTLSLSCYRVQQHEIDEIIKFIKGLDIKAMTTNILNKLFLLLDTGFDISALSDEESGETA